MDDLNTTLTEREEMYLITLAHLGELGMIEPISLTQLAEALDVQPISANEMVHKLEEAQLVRYVPYKGVSLEPHGRNRAQAILRSRRLWEVFFVEKLGLSLAQADALACDLEHATPPDVADRLATFLNEPMHSPSGYLIPQASMAPLVGQPLSAFSAGAQVRVIALPLNTSLRRFLHDQRIEVDSELHVLAVGQDDERLISVNDQHVQLSADVAANIVVRAADARDTRSLT